jgi:preprotein translocase subunit SecY
MFAIFTGSSAGGFLNTMMGNSLSSMSLFALSISPYISASIVMQLLIVAIPRLEEIQKDGAVGQKKIERLIRIVGGVFAFISALAISINFGKQGLFVNYTWYMVAYATIIWTAGAIFLMQLGEWMTNHLVGSGISLMLLFNMLSSLPGDAVNLYGAFAANKPVWQQVLFVAIAIVVVFAIYAYVVLLNNAEKRIRISSSRNSSGRMMQMEQNSLPLKLNMGGVMPIIFSSTIMSLPGIITNFIDINPDGFISHVVKLCSQGYWFHFDKDIWYTLGIIPYIGLTYLFSHFYMMISFNAKDIADNLRKSGTTVPGIRPGQATAEYLDKQAKSMLNLGTTLLMIIALLPTVFSGATGIGVSFGGTTILIIVSVILETKSKIEAQTSSVQYHRFIKK